MGTSYISTYFCLQPIHVKEALEEGMSLKQLVDTKAGDWNLKLLASLHELAKHCLDNKKRRPDIEQVCVSYVFSIL